MAESMHSHFGGEVRKAEAVHLPGWALPALLGLAAGVVAALFVTVHWTIAVVAALAVMVLAAVENEIFLLAVIFLLPLSWVRPEGSLRDLMTPLRILVLVGFFAGRLLRGSLNWRRLWSSPISRLLSLFVGVAVVSVAIGPIGWGHDSLAQCYRLASAVGFYFLAVAWIDTRQRLRRVVMTILASVCLLGLFSVLQEAVGGYTRLWFYFNPPGPDFIPWHGRAPSLLPYSNALAGCLDIMLPLALACWISCSGRLKKAGCWAFALGTLALAFSQSLGGLVSFGFLLVLAILSFVRPRRRQIMLLAGFLASGAGFYLARAVLNPAHFAAAGLSLPPDVVSRLLQFHAAWVLFLQHPLFGVGFGDFGVASVGLLPQVSWMSSVSLMASNLYLNLLAETGAVGCFVYLYMLLLILRKAGGELRLGGREFWPVFAFGALGAASAVLVHGLVDYLISAQYATILCFVLALFVVSSRMRLARTCRDVGAIVSRPTGRRG